MLKPQPTPPPPYVSQLLLGVSYSYAALLVLLALLQLLFFGNFLLYVGSFFSAGATGGTVFIASILVGVELFALPFLLRLRLSPLARFCSALLVLTVPLAWSLVAMTANTKAGYGFLNVGFLLWACLSFWALGGQKAMRLRER